MIFCGAQPPQRRAVGMFGATRAGGIGALVKDRGVGVDLFRARRADMGLFLGVGAHRVDEALLEVAGQLHLVGVGHRAVGVGELDRALRQNAAGVLEIGDAVGFEHLALIIDLGVALGGDGMGLVVVDDAVGLDDHRPLLVATEPAKRSFRVCAAAARREAGSPTKMTRPVATAEKTPTRIARRIPRAGAAAPAAEKPRRRAARRF